LYGFLTRSFPRSAWLPANLERLLGCNRRKDRQTERSDLANKPRQVADLFGRDVADERLELPDALLVNLGTFDRERREAVEIAVKQVVNAGRPWVLDPVFVDRSRPRAQFARTLMARSPTAIRLNAAEFAAVADVQAGEKTPERLALDRCCVVALSGAIDIVTDGARTAKIENGDPLMARVTAMGCAGTALVTAALAVETDRWLATLGALLAFAVAGECAAARARGPGTLAIEILDTLANLDRETLLTRARLS